MVIVCRPDLDAARSVQNLSDAGIDAMAVPILARAPLPDAVWPVAADLVFVTSPFAARLTLKAFDRGLLLREGRPTAVAAIAKTTGGVFAAANVIPTVLAQGGALGLARAVAASGFTQSLFYPVSRAAGKEPEHHAAVALLRTVCEVTVAQVYDTAAVSDAAHRIASAPQDATWLFHSPSAVRAFIENARSAPAAVWCSGRSTLRAWQTLKPGTWPAARLQPEEMS